MDMLVGLELRLVNYLRLLKLGLTVKKNSPEYKFQYLNILLIPLIGAENTDDWWTTGNRAFGGVPPITIYETRFEDIKSYLLKFYNGDFS